MDAVPVNNFSWILEGELAGSAFPDNENAIKWLAKQGIRAVVTLTEKPAPDPVNTTFETFHVPIQDFSAPTFDLIDQAVGFIETQRAESHPVLVHCAAGFGRTGTVLAAYLVSTGLDADAAIARIRELRPGSIESDAQAEAVKAYARTLQR